jgi:UDP-glucose 4-epimerase
MSKPKKILITGSTGYIGNCLSVYFGELGIDVVGLDIEPHPVIKDTPNFTFYNCDVRDKKKMEEIFQKEKPSHVLHLAYLMDPHHDRKFEYDVDVMGSKNIFDISNETKSVKQFVKLSSTSIYGAHKDNPKMLKETDSLRPADYNYAIYKKEIEKFYHNYDKRSDMKLVILRMCTAVGPSYYKPGGVVSSVAKAPLLIQVGPVTNAVQFIHEDDVMALFNKVVCDKEVEDTFNLCSDSSVALKELAKEYKKILIPVPLFVLRFVFWILWYLRIADLTPAIARLMAYPIVADPSKIMKKYNYEFEYTTQEAFTDAVKKRTSNGTL